MVLGHSAYDDHHTPLFNTIIWSVAYNQAVTRYSPDFCTPLIYIVQSIHLPIVCMT